ncbi:hypothetical protein AKJ39_04925 [candidate division MSBL1 archaeon SCGC-AAA259J03]|uniref:HicB-like antitoxin of toxin-antitoxin system domain-containing protein n=1 Tax=candidate division MSBL1 archaeon SCGC-AAA259J03 TaxID=1698269 RepID=A0A656YVC5_9EURY|nr:hypothetical protein AKJ39_04925 [candidate division MSBL1 archaeon SCGC-AAA259J03]
MSTKIKAPTEEAPYHLWKEGDMWVAKDGRTEVASQGETRREALENLDEAVALYRGEIGREPTDAELRELGVEPEDNKSGELPDVLK